MKGHLEQIRLDKLNLPEPPLRSSRDGLERLAGSVKELGLLVPPLVRPLGSGEHHVIGGVGRVAALRASGARADTLVPCFVADVSDEEAALLALAENVVREPLAPYDLARRLELLQDDYGMAQTRIAQALGVAQADVSRQIAVLRLAPEVVGALRDGRLTMAAASALLPLADDPEAQRAVLARALEEGLPSGDVAALAAEHLHEGALPLRRFEVPGRAKVTIRTARNGELLIQIRAKSDRGLGTILGAVMKEVRSARRRSKGEP